MSSKNNPENIKKLIPVLSEKEKQEILSYYAIHRKYESEIALQADANLKAHPVFASLIGTMTDAAKRAQNKTSRELQQGAIVDNNWIPYIEYQLMQGAVYAQMGIEFREWYDVAIQAKTQIQPYIFKECGNNVELMSALCGMNRFLDIAMSVVGESYLNEKQNIIEKDREVLDRSLQEVADYKYAIDESAIVAITDQKGIIKHVNDNFCKISKYSREELLGQDHRIINSGYHDKAFIKNIWVTIANGNVWKGELKNKAKDGTYYWVDTTIVPFLDDQKKPFQYLAIRADITERKKSEETIEHERVQLRRSIQEVTDYKYAIDESAIVAITDQKGVIKHVNDNFCKISKFSRQELIGQDHRIINSGYHDKAFIKNIWVTIANGNVWKGELKNKAKDGTYYWVDTTIVPFLDDQKKPFQYLAIRADITERKKSEETIEHERVQLRRSIQEVTDYKYAIDESAIVAITDQTGIIKHVNDNFCKISKFNRQELIGQDHRIINSNHHSKEFIKNIWVTIANGNVWKGEIKNKAKDGTYYWVDTTIVPFLDKDKKPFQYLAIRSDITERKLAEEIIENERAALRQSIQEVADYKYAIDESAIVAITDQTGIIKHVNDNFCKISKYSKAELIGQDHRIVNSGYHDKAFIKNIWVTIANGNVWKGEIKNKAKDDSFYWVDTTIVPFLDKNKKPYQYLAIRSDITERKKSEEEVIVLNARLEKKVALRTRDLQESLDKIANFQYLFETIPGKFLVLLPDLTISAVSDEYLNATMVKRAEIIGKHLFEVFPDNPDDPTADGVSNLRKSLQIVLQTKKSHTMEIQRYDVRKPDGAFEERYWQPINKPVLNSQNEVVYLTHGVVDITVQLKREAEILRISNENQDLYNSAPCGYLSVDATIFITNINQTLLDWLGYSVKEVIGKLKFEDLLSPSSREKHLSTFEEVFRQYVENGFINDLEFDFQRKDGTTFPTILNSAAVFDEQGNFVRSRTVVLDNTFRKKAEHNLREVNAELEAQAHKLQASEEELKAQQEELMQANIELEEKTLLLEENHQIVSEKNHELTLASTELQLKAEELSQSSRYKSEFLANMSHELRTPLNSILLLSHILAENGENNLSDEQTEFARVINNSGNSLLELINEILDLSKIESGNMSVEIESVEVENICKTAKDLFSEIAKEKRIKFSVNFDKSKHQIIKTDRVRLEQILKNFLSNAIKFTENGSVTMIVRAPTLSEANWIHGRSQDYVIFEVIDTGIGIPKEKHNLVFEAFKQADGSTRRKYGGTGLGLSISKKIAQLLGGDVLLKSEIGMGSSFSLIIPIDSSLLAKKDALVNKDGKLEIQPAPVVGREKEYSNSGVRISDDQDIIGPDDTVFLLVDTNRETAYLITKTLHENGHKVLIASDEVNGMELAVQYQPKGIIVSMSIPEKSGWQILAELKANHSIRHIPVILLSDVELSTNEVIANGAINYHKTPLASKAINQLLEEFLDIHQQKPKQVLLIDGNKIHIQAIENFITTSVVRCIPTTNSKQAAEALVAQKPDCIVIDMGLSDAEVYEILDTVKNDFALRRLPIILYAGMAFSQHAEKRIRPYSDLIVIRIADTFKDLSDKVSFYLHQNAVQTIDRKHLKPYLEESALGGKHILLVDDDVRNIFSLTKVLESQKMKVTSAVDGNEALAILAKDKSIDLVLLDMMMPNKDGYETIVEIRKDEKIKHKKIIAVTAKAMLGDREKCIRAGANDYVTKPVDVDQLISLLKVWLYN